MQINNQNLSRSRKILYGALSLVGSAVVFAITFVTASVSVAPNPAYAVASTSNAIVTLNVDTGIAINAPGNSNMSTHINVVQNSAVGTTTWIVTTNDVNGYTLALNATATPAMQQNATTTINDYQTGAPNTWSVASGAAFGYSAFGGDVATSTWGTGSVCNGGTNGNATSTTLKYKGFTTSPFTVATKAATTSFTGNSTTVCYAVEQNNFFIPSGTYQATIVATATAL